MTDTFFDRIDRVCPIVGADAVSGLSLSSDFLNIAIFSSACVSEMTIPAWLREYFGSPAQARVSAGLVLSVFCDLSIVDAWQIGSGAAESREKDKMKRGAALCYYSAFAAQIYDSIRGISMQGVFRLAGLTIVLLATSNVSFAEPDSSNASGQKAVLVTGASTGIGRKITEVLAANGYFVYAGARKQKDLDALNEIANVQSIRLDVTIQEEIDAAVETVREGGRGLYGLVNNAGVGTAGPLIEVDEKDVKWLFDVNIFGVFRITQAFAPLIIEGKGRITTIGSIAGILSGPFYGPYSMSKHAIEAYTDALAAEMERFDVQVSVIEPGNYRSQISKSGRERMGGMNDAKEKSPYAEDYRRRLEGSADRSQYKDPDEVADAAMHALFDADPKLRYMVVPNREEAAWTIGRAMQKMVQLNEGQEHSFSRNELIAMLDKAIGADEK